MFQREKQVATTYHMSKMLVNKNRKTVVNAKGMLKC